MTKIELKQLIRECITEAILNIPFLISSEIKRFKNSTDKKEKEFYEKELSKYIEDIKNIEKTSDLTEFAKKTRDFKKYSEFWGKMVSSINEKSTIKTQKYNLDV